ncbi:MAG TPA: SIR2 family protein [Chloroflexia bacterium]|nr:SIR2 family protein [Chloroflexia bacterium]
MIDAIISLAFAIHQNKGVYALLLGSGVSRSAGIPTGWEVIIDLTSKAAKLSGEDCGLDPATWYTSKFGEKPSYSKLLDALAKSPSERSQLLRRYFEPNEEEQEQNLKVPTAAHIAIANLVASGYIQVIITTNFDRLLEKALEAVGVVPTVISTPDAAQGARPIQHTRCTIIKINGDYIDTRIRNTEEELEEYDQQLTTLLDRVFDEYGLIICGWSAEWDAALRRALERSKSRRFTTYWTVRDKPAPITGELIALRGAEIVKIVDSNSFFQQLEEKVHALEDMNRPHPLSVKAAVVTVKRYLADNVHRIRLYDLVMQEVENFEVQSSEEHFPVAPSTPFNVELLVERMRRYETLTEMLRALMVTGCYWSDAQQVDIWQKCFERISNPRNSTSGIVAYLALKRYPALLLLYAGGLAALASGRYRTVAALFADALVNEPGEGYRQPAVLYVNTYRVMPYNQKNLPGRERNYTPLSDYLGELLRHDLRDFIPDQIQYNSLFDRFEYLLALSHAHYEQKRSGSIIVPLGSFLWRNRHERGPTIHDSILTELSEMGENWPLLKAGLFDRSVDRVIEIISEVDKQVKLRRSDMF